MLIPKKVKHRKWQRGRSKKRLVETRGLTLAYGSYGLKAMSPAWMDGKQLESARKTITNYEEAKNQKVSRVLLVGGLINMPNFANYCQQKLGREVFIGNAFARVVYPQSLSPVIQELSSIFAIATGLAMREI